MHTRIRLLMLLSRTTSLSVCGPSGGVRSQLCLRSRIFLWRTPIRSSHLLNAPTRTPTCGTQISVMTCQTRSGYRELGMAGRVESYAV